MDTKEISAIIIAKCNEVYGLFDTVNPDVNKHFAKNNARDPEAYRLGPTNWSYIACKDNRGLLEFVLTHPEFSHFSQRDRFSVTVYWHHETAPNRVSSVASFDPKYLQDAYRIIGDELGAARAWAAGYEFAH